MAKSKYHQVVEGEWIRVPMKNWDHQCCDCSLVHRINFRLVKDTPKSHPKIEMQFFRNGKATGGAR